MTTRKTYQHVCPAARALEAVGDKWALLIVRDLLPGPQRFSDLMRYLGGITPKWLTLRLRDLEAAGIVERQQEPGRREVWYRLTSKGQDLAPVVEALSVWGLEHAMRPPEPGEPVHPMQTTMAVALSFNRHRIGLPHSVAWVVRFAPGRAWTVRYDGTTWSVVRGEDADAAVVVETTPELWVSFLMATPAEREQYVAPMHISGAAERVEEFLATFGWKQHDRRGALPAAVRA